MPHLETRKPEAREKDSLVVRVNQQYSCVWLRPAGSRLDALPTLTQLAIVVSKSLIEKKYSGIFLAKHTTNNNDLLPLCNPFNFSKCLHIYYLRSCLLQRGFFFCSTCKKITPARAFPAKNLWLCYIVTKLMFWMVSSLLWAGAGWLFLWGIVSIWGFVQHPYHGPAYFQLLPALFHELKGIAYFPHYFKSLKCILWWSKSHTRKTLGTVVHPYVPWYVCSRPCVYFLHSSIALSNEWCLVNTDW